MLLKNTDGEKSVSFTMMVVAFTVVTLWLLVSVIAKIGHIEIRQFSGTEAMAYLGPILALYWGRKGQTQKKKEAAAGENAAPVEEKGDA